MPLSLIYITNNPEVALIAEKNGVDRIMVDLETLGKEDRQKNMDTVKSRHAVEDVREISGCLTTSEMLVRINPINKDSKNEIERVIDAGADRIMLPMWKSKDEVDLFLDLVSSRSKTILLLETKEAAENIDSILENPLIDEIHIGLNDLHLSYKMDFMFEPLACGIVEDLVSKFKKKGITYGFGGIARVGEGTLSAEKIIMEHYRLGSSMAILSRSFCNAQEIEDIDSIKKVFEENMKNLRDYESTLADKTERDYEKNHKELIDSVDKIVKQIKEKKNNG